MELTDTDRRSPYYDEMISLYNRSFPENERKPLDPILDDPSSESEIYSIVDEGNFIGMVVLLNHDDITHIIYFAVEESMRCHGYGSRILQLVQERYPGNRILVDVESPDEHKANNLQRKKRIEFYLRNGFMKSEVTYSWIRENYQILVAGGNLNRREFSRFWDYIYSHHAGFDY